MTFTDENARTNGAKGGEAKATRVSDRLAEALAALPPLDSTENAKARLETISSLAVAGVLPGSQAGAAVRAVEVWLKIEAHDMDRRRIRALEDHIASLEHELAATKGLRRVG